MRRAGVASGPDPLAALTRDPLRPYYLLHGKEEFLLERGLRTLRERLLPSGRSGNGRTLWADQDVERLGDALADLRTPSLFGGPQLLVVRHAEALREGDQDRLLATLPEVGAAGALVLVARDPDLRRRLFAACVRAGAAYHFPALDDPRDAREAQAWVGRLARERDLAITPEAAALLVDRCGTDLGVLANEIEKLRLHVGSGVRVDPTHVRALVTDARANRVEEFTDGLARRDLTGAARALRHLLAQGEPAVRIVAFVASNLRRALHVAELAEAGCTAEEISRRLQMPGWLVSRSLGRGRATDLICALGTLQRLDLELKSSRPAEAVFEAALLALAAR